MQRRQVLALAGAGGIAGLAGCLAQLSGNSEDGRPDRTAGATHRDELASGSDGARIASVMDASVGLGVTGVEETTGTPPIHLGWTANVNLDSSAGSGYLHDLRLEVICHAHILTLNHLLGPAPIRGETPQSYRYDFGTVGSANAADEVRKDGEVTIMARKDDTYEEVAMFTAKVDATMVHRQTTRPWSEVREELSVTENFTIDFSGGRGSGSGGSSCGCSTA